MKPKWEKDSEGDYTLTVSTGTAWLAKTTGSRNQKPWNGRATAAGSTTRISAWTLPAAKRDAEKVLGVTRES